MNLILSGPPGSGKGTQAALLASHFGLHHLSTGDLLRDEIRSGSQLGAAAKDYLDSGRLAPDEIVIGAVRQKLTNAGPNSGFLLDGFPRTLAQAAALEQVIHDAHLDPPKVLALQVSEEISLKRLSGRLTCPQCHAVFHAEHKPPRNDRICDNCGTQLVRRADEQPEVLRERLRAYARETEPLLSFYRERGMLVEVPGDASVQEVNKEILSALSRHLDDNPEK